MEEDGDVESDEVIEAEDDTAVEDEVSEEATEADEMVEEDTDITADESIEEEENPTDLEGTETEEPIEETDNLEEDVESDEVIEAEDTVEEEDTIAEDEVSEEATEADEMVEEEADITADESVEEEENPTDLEGTETEEPIEDTDDLEGDVESDEVIEAEDTVEEEDTIAEDEVSEDATEEDEEVVEDADDLEGDVESDEVIEAEDTAEDDTAVEDETIGEVTAEDEVVEGDEDITTDESIEEEENPTDLEGTETEEPIEDTDDLEEAVPEQSENLIDQEDIGSVEVLTEEMADKPQQEQHTFEDWINPDNYDEDGHYIGDGQDFGYKPEGMEASEYGEQIDQQAQDAYEEHLAHGDAMTDSDVADTDTEDTDTAGAGGDSGEGSGVSEIVPDDTAGSGKHTFENWINPDNYDENGHYIGDGQDFGYKPGGMEASEYGEQITQDAKDAYAEHIKQQHMPMEDQAQAYAEYAEALDNYGKTPEELEEVTDVSDDMIPEDILEDISDDADDLSVDNNEVLQDIEDDIIPEDLTVEDINTDAVTTEDMNTDEVSTDEMNADTVNEEKPKQSAMEAWLDPKNYDANGHFVENPDSLTDDNRWDPNRDTPGGREIPPKPFIKEAPELDLEESAGVHGETADQTMSESSHFGMGPAQAQMYDYMCEHNYGKGDYPEYSQDPEWQRLNAALKNELGIPADVPAYDNDNIPYGNTEPMNADPTGPIPTEPVIPSANQQEPSVQGPIENSVGNQDMKDIKEEIAKDLMDNYDVGKADFHDFDPDVASSVSDAVRDAKNDFPDLEVKFLGSIDTQVAGIRDEYIDYYTKELAKIPNSGWNEDEIRSIAEHNADKLISNWGLDDTDGTFAWSLHIPENVDPTGGNLDQYTGVAINNTYASDCEAFTDAKQEEVRIKHKPIGCDTPRATIDHELGHEIDNMLDACHDEKMIGLYEEMMSNGNAQDVLSGYSQTNIKEFIAEGYSEYRNNPQPREYATKIYERLMQLNQRRKGRFFWKKK